MVPRAAATGPLVDTHPSQPPALPPLGAGASSLAPSLLRDSLPSVVPVAGAARAGALQPSSPVRPGASQWGASIPQNRVLVDIGRACRHPSDNRHSQPNRSFPPRAIRANLSCRRSSGGGLEPTGPAPGKGRHHTVHRVPAHSGDPPTSKWGPHHLGRVSNSAGISPATPPRYRAHGKRAGKSLELLYRPTPRRH